VKIRLICVHLCAISLKQKNFVGVEHARPLLLIEQERKSELDLHELKLSVRIRLIRVYRIL